MDYQIDDAPEETIFRLGGRMTFVDHEKFREVLAAFDARPGKRLIFDLSGLEFVDSSGLGMFIIARDAALKKNAVFSLRGARDDVRRLITIAKFHKMFDIAD